MENLKHPTPLDINEYTLWKMNFCYMLAHQNICLIKKNEVCNTDSNQPAATIGSIFTKRRRKKRQKVFVSLAVLLKKLGLSLMFWVGCQWANFFQLSSGLSQAKKKAELGSPNWHVVYKIKNIKKKCSIQKVGAQKRHEIQKHIMCQPVVHVTNWLIFPKKKGQINFYYFYKMEWCDAYMTWQMIKQINIPLLWCNGSDLGCQREKAVSSLVSSQFGQKSQSVAGPTSQHP